MGTGGAEQRLASLPASDSGFLSGNLAGRRRQKEATRADGRDTQGRRRSSNRRGFAAAAGYCLAVLVGMSGTSEVPMSAMAATTRQRQHPVAAIARNLFHPSARERRYIRAKKEGASNPQVNVPGNVDSFKLASLYNKCRRGVLF